MFPRLIIWVLLSAHITWAFSFRAANSDRATCDCRGKKIRNGGNAASKYVCHDIRLGPTALPKKSPASNIFLDYDRFGGLTPEKFLETWTNKTGDYIYPPNHGFKADWKNKSTASYYTLPRGVYLDHFGSEWDHYLHLALTPFSQRSLPPSVLNLNPTDPVSPTDYYVYSTNGELTLLGAPVAAWFGQPGNGIMFYSEEPIKGMIKAGELRKEDPSVLIKNGGTCS